eukprot:Seg1393.5 transcript_id=Seg1393.5/GoldUCD/mRNA.D3Y31 product="Thioredoxin-like protein 4B" protein_id=Seg1393.5/GoldUCD/D3Y31
MSFLLQKLESKKDIDVAIRTTEDKVLVLRFGRETDAVCLQLDDVLSKAAPELARMAEIFTIDADGMPIYVEYFDITLIPATVFFYNGQHIKVDYGTQDHTKFIGAFKTKQDFIDLVEVILRGALRGKLMVTSPIDQRDIPKYNLLYKDI